jgi:hypothetical protein
MGDEQGTNRIFLAMSRASQHRASSNSKSSEGVHFRDSQISRKVIPPLGWSYCRPFWLDCVGSARAFRIPARDATSRWRICLSALALFFMQSASFLAFQRTLEKGQGCSNCQSLFGIERIPSDNYIRGMLDGADPALLQPCFERMEQLLVAPTLRPAFARLDDLILIAWDGTEYFCSQKLGCPHCLRRKGANGAVENYHTLLAATAVAPGHAKVIPLFPEFVALQDGAEKQDCERNAAKRWHARHAGRLRALRPVYLGDDLFACQPIVSMLMDAGDDFIFTCKETSHKALYDFIDGAEPERHTQTIRKGKKVETRRYRWITGVPRDGNDAAWSAGSRWRFWTVTASSTIPPPG